MPEYWYSNRSLKEMPEGEQEFNKRIVADRKPYFMTYVYPELRTENNNYLKDNDSGALLRFAVYGVQNIDELREYEPKTKDMQQFYDNYVKFIPTGNGACLVNRICWLFEKEFDGFLAEKQQQTAFNYSILKSNVNYDPEIYEAVYSVYRDYLLRMDDFQRKCRTEKVDSDYRLAERMKLISIFKCRCELICTNEKELCDIIVDMCYTSESSKQFAWDICGEQIVDNLLAQNNNTIHYPELVEDGAGEFEYCGRQLAMKAMVIYETDNFE